MMESIIQMIEYIVEHNGDIHVGMVIFSNTGDVYFGLAAYATTELIVEAVRHTPHIGGYTNTAEGLWLAYSEVFGKSGDRPDATNVAIVITGGESTVNTEMLYLEATRLKNVAQVITVGITEKINMTEIGQIASNIYDIFVLYHFEELPDEISRILENICVAYVDMYEMGPSVGK